MKRSGISGSKGLRPRCGFTQTGQTERRHAVGDHVRNTGPNVRFCYQSSRYTFSGMCSMEGTMQVAKWGNSLAVRLPAAIVEALGLKEGDDIEITVAGARAFEVSKKPEVAEVLARLRKDRGRLPEGFKFDWLETNER